MTIDERPDPARAAVRREPLENNEDRYRRNLVKHNEDIRQLLASVSEPVRALLLKRFQLDLYPIEWARSFAADLERLRALPGPQEQDDVEEPARLDGDCPLGPLHMHAWTLGRIGAGQQCEYCMQTREAIAKQINRSALPGGATLPDLELVAAAVHAAWMEQKRAKGITSAPSQSTGEEQLRPYAELSNEVQEYDRATVRAVYAAIAAASSSALPGGAQEEKEEDDEPSVLGAGCGLTPLPTQADGEAVWRAAYVARMVERGLPVEDARACSAAAPVVLSDDPADAADAELEYWENDGGPDD